MVEGGGTITEANYTEQVKRVAVELLSPLSDIDKVEIVMRTIPGMTKNKVEQILKVIDGSIGPIAGGEE